MIYSRWKLKTIKSNYFVWKIKIATVYFVVPTDIERKIVHQFLVAIHFNKVTCIFSDVLDTVDFIDATDGSVVFRTCEKERKRVILQIGTCDPDRALNAAKLV